MSKRNSSGGGSSNTLFNYFLKSPLANKSPKPVTETKKNETLTPLKPVSNGNTKRKNEDKLHKQNSKESDSEAEVELKPKKLKLDEPESNDDEEEDIPVVPKRRRIRLVSDNSDDSDAENNDQAADNSSMKNKLESSFKFEPKISSPSSSPASKAKKQPKLDESKEVNTSFSEARLPNTSEESNNWNHCKLDWLRPENIRDANKRKPDHPEYNPKTLFVPEDFKKKQTPGHKQWWDIKAAHYDCVLFFKVGKFYELYHMDAAVGVNELGFSYMKGDFAHSGFPETAYARMSSSLVQKGYKVARVEQTETPEMLAERTKSSATKEKVVRREVCQVTCKGIEVYGLQDSGPDDSAASYMIAIAENDLGVGRSQYGVCFIDTSIGLFHLGQFEDDKYSSRLLTTLAHHPPALVLHERSHISERTAKILRLTCQAARKEALAPQKEFWSAEKTLKTMAEKYYKGTAGVNWPEGLEPMLSDSDMLGLTPAENYTLAVRALGACIFYLTDTLLDIQIMGMARYQAYHPPDTVGGEANSPKNRLAPDNMPSNMVLDACTLANLHIVGDETSLVAKLNHCATPMGKRLLHQWVCSPTCNIEVIKERQKAISFLLEQQSTVQDVRAVLATLPDMERLLTKIHTLGNLNRSKDHPDSKAILYEMKAYSKRKVIDFISILNGFLSAVSVMSRFKDTESALLKRITHFAPEGQFPEYSEVLNFFKGAFDHNLAQKEGTILPEKGVDTEYDTAMETIEEIKSDLDDYLKSQEKHFNCKVNYFGSDKKRYQLEVPESKCGKANHGYNFEGTRKGYKRYSTAESKELLARMMAAEDHKTAVLKDLSRRIFEKFSQSHALWQKAIFCLSTLDVIIALAEYTRLQSCDMCIPELLLATDDVKPFISILEGRHPCMACKESGLDDYIPNDTCLGSGEWASLVLLTGPNMGGKSTLMRQLGLLTIMAQIGCHIPAAECSLTVVDRIFTRLGAHDDIMTGQSTFFVELSETGAILKHATPHSLVLLDELGRGTSTYDGTAIAAAVLDELCVRRCRTVFSTHYHTLVEDVKNNSAVSLAHMSCMVETEENQSEDAENIAQETVTFMYKLSSGACPKSYGFNAARLAGISKAITRRAHQVSAELEKEANLVAMFKKLYNHQGTEGLKDVLMAARKFEVLCS